jgi:hypothetical protein
MQSFEGMNPRYGTKKRDLKKAEMGNPTPSPGLPIEKELLLMNMVLEAAMAGEPGKAFITEASEELARTIGGPADPAP